MRRNQGEAAVTLGSKLGLIACVLIAAMSAGGAARAMHATWDFGICAVPSAHWTIQEGIRRCKTSVTYSQLPEEKAANNYALAELYYMNKQYEEALGAYTTAIGWWHDEPILFFARGDAYAALGKADLAREDYDEGARLGGNSPERSAKRCWMRALRGGPFDLALADCNTALTANPDDGSTLFSRCLVHFRSGRFGLAMEDCDAALKRKPKLTGALYFRGLARIHSGDANGGAADVAAAKAASPRVADGYALFGITP